MRQVTASCLRSLERWSPKAFLVAGVVLLASPVSKGLALFADVSPPVWLVVVLVFPGLLVALAGLLGTYPQLADESPRLALTGGVAAVIAGSGVTLLFGWVLASNVLPSSRGLVVTAPPEPAFLLVMLSIATGFILFGLAGLRAAVFSRPTGLALLGFAIPWIGLPAVTAVYSGDLPGWLLLAAYGVMPVALLVTGHSIRDVAPRAARDTLEGDLLAG